MADLFNATSHHSRDRLTLRLGERTYSNHRALFACATESEATHDMAEALRQILQSPLRKVDLPMAQVWAGYGQGYERHAELIGILTDRIVQAITKVYDFDPNFVILDNLKLQIVRRNAAEPELPQFLQAALYGQRLGTEQLAGVLRQMQVWAKDNTDAVNRALESIDLSKADPTVAVSVARIIAPLREGLSNWNGYVQRLGRSLQVKGLDANKILRGLI